MNNRRLEKKDEIIREIGKSELKKLTDTMPSEKL